MLLVLIITLLWLAVTLLILSITLLILIISLLRLTVSLLILSITLLILTISLLWLAIALILIIALLLAIACLLLAIICLLLRLCVACLLLRLCVARLLLRLCVACLLLRLCVARLLLRLCVACLLLCESRLLRIGCLLLRVTRLSVILNRTIHQIAVKWRIAVVVRRRNTVHPGNLALIRLPCQHEVIKSRKEMCEYENDQNCNAGTVSKQRADLAEGCPRCQKRNDYEHKARTVCDGSGKPAGGCACRIILFQLESCRKAGGINESATHKDQIESPITEG